MTMDKALPISNSDRMPCSQTTYMHAFIAPLYSAPAKESAMKTHFLMDQKMGPPPNINTYPKVDFQSMVSPAQSESVKLTNSSSESAT